MSEEEINVAIAECLGWDTDPIESHPWNSRGQWVIKPGDVKRELRSKIMNLPNYYGDLNVCQEIIQLLESQGWSCIIIAENNKRCCTFWRRGVEYKVIGNYLPTAICEAFLRTLGKWRE